MKLTALTESDVRAALPMARCVESMKAAFAALSSGRAEVPQRLSLATPAAGTFLVKPAVLEGAFGAKLISVNAGNAERGLPLIHGLVVLFDPETGRPLALLDGDFLTAWRTGAAAGAATGLLAREDAAVAALLGTGVQAGTVALAVDSVRDIDTLRVYSRAKENVDRFVREMGPRLGSEVVAVESPADAVRGADVVSAATTSPEPVFEGTDLSPGVHVNGMGSFTPEMQELDAETVGRATVFVDSRTACAAEAGDLLLAAEGTRPEDWTELGEVAAGTAPGRRSEDAITLFKSVGVAVQDVQAAADAWKAARQAGLGREIEL